MEWEPVIGLEVHTQLSTRSKLFSSTPTDFGAEPNTQVALLDAAIPGTLPVLNREALTLAIKFGIAIEATIPNTTRFARKNYFYPDLPKGYQISQGECPIVQNGHLDIQLEDGSWQRVGITRAHLEEDAGKSVHDAHFGEYSGIDLNRAGNPLLEIVSEPDMHSAEAAVAYLKTLHRLIRYLEISDANMQEGSFRCDVNISLKPKDSQVLGTRAEIKNLNSFRFIEKAIHFEINRQRKILEAGGTIQQETRQYDPNKHCTRSMRLKESAAEYRYFPDPDLLPISITESDKESLSLSLPELPKAKYHRYIENLALPHNVAEFLASRKDIALYFEAALKKKDKTPIKLLANWIIGELSAYINKATISSFDLAPVSPKALVELLEYLATEQITGPTAKIVFEAMWHGEGSAQAIIEKRGLKQISDNSAIETLIQKVLDNHTQQVADYRAGKTKIWGYLIGQAMKEARGKISPTLLNAEMKKMLEE